MKTLDLITFVAVGAGVICPAGASGTCDTGLPQVNASPDALRNILQIVFGVIAAIAVLIIVIAGFTFVVSGGNPEQSTKARETIIYAAVGLVISLSAEVLVSFVLTKVG